MRQQNINEEEKGSGNSLHLATDVDATNSSLRSDAPVTIVPVEAVSGERSALTAEEVEELLGQLRQEAAKRKKQQNYIQYGIGAIMTLIFLVVIFSWVAKGKLDLGDFASYGGLFGLLGMAAGATKAQKAATLKLANTEDIRAVGPLSEALHFGDNQIKKIAEERLTLLLPRLQASDAALLNKEQLSALNKAVSLQIYTQQNIPFVLATLKAFEQVGDETVLPTVERAAEGVKLVPEIVQAAKECLPYLEKRIEAQKAQATLLRPASACDYVLPAELLRPASGPGDTNPQEMLRASHAPNSETDAN